VPWATFVPVKQHQPRLSAPLCAMGIHCVHRYDVDQQVRQTHTVWEEPESMSRQDGDYRCCWCAACLSTHKLANVVHGPYRPLST
jgi:hypothetical protein